MIFGEITISDKQKWVINTNPDLLHMLCNNYNDITNKTNMNKTNQPLITRFKANEKRTNCDGIS